jgi:hypothetical protein
MSPGWTAADYARDAVDQQAEANEAINAEIRAQRDYDHHLIYDDRPTRRELEADERDARYGA